MAYIERDKRKKFTPKTERCIYLSISPTHSHDTYKLWHIEKGILLYRRNVAFNERIFPGRLLQPEQQVMNDRDRGTDLIGLSFNDDGETFVIHETGENDGTATLLYSNPTNQREDGKHHESTVAEVRTKSSQNEHTTSTSLPTKHTELLPADITAVTRQNNTIQRYQITYVSGRISRIEQRIVIQFIIHP
jgi:hypothetical protein